jgi:hypothetical protein
MELARAHRRAAAIRQALERARGSGLMDAATGLFTPTCSPPTWSASPTPPASAIAR